MSHELRTPLNAIIGFSDVMISGIHGHISQEKYIEYIGDINQSGTHLLRLINDILDISKIESGTVKLHESVVNIGKAVEICLRLVQNKLRQGGIKLEKRIPKTVPDIFADERRINQILLNLMSNAIKFTPNGGRIRITATVRASGVLVLSISDTGIGISASQMENVMSEFGQVDNALARKTEGTGLGLPLTRGLMDIHDGILKISSEPGQGTKVQAIFPKYRVVGSAETE
ncbi:MAG TPA: HAMP domain-containing histidine kinase, partial [Rhodospirillales bacterium]|nr:HAMP domain-containing histidine kinase [Rhodospirillales bacterium]